MKWIVLAALAGVFLVVDARTPRATAQDRPPMVVFFGDSLTYGLHASTPDDTYRQITVRRLAQTVDAGAPQAFIQAPYGLLDDAIDKLPLVLAARPTLVFLELGHHEIWSTQDQVDLFEERYSYILDALLRSGAEVVPTTLAWLGAEPDSFAYNASLRINTIIRRLTTERGLIVADLWAATDRRRELLSTEDDVSFIEPYRGDDLHPNDAGHRALADAVWQAYWSMRHPAVPRSLPV